MSNSFSFTGNLGKDAELKQVGQGQVLNFSVGNSVGYGDKKQTIWLNCAVWGKRGTSLEPHLLKGSKVWIEGEFSPRTYQKNDGTQGVSYEVKVDKLDMLSKSESGSTQPQQQAPAQQPQAPQQEDDPGMPF
jgi:single-strand DNA-binding protein